MAHVIRVKYSNNDAVLSIDGKEMSISEDVASLIESAIRTYVHEWLAPEGDGVFISPTSTMKVRVTKGNDEVVFVIEE